MILRNIIIIQILIIIAILKIHRHMIIHAIFVEINFLYIMLN